MSNRLSFIISICLVGVGILVFSGVSLKAETDHVVISQVQITGGSGKTTNDFIELYNPTGADVDLKGMRLVKRSKTATTDTLIKSWTGSTIIKAHGFYLWANKDFISIPISPDASTSVSIADDNGVAIRNGPNDTGAIVDSLAWGAAENIFGDIFKYIDNPTANQSLERDLNGTTFFLQTTAHPRNSQSQIIASVTATVTPNVSSTPTQTPMPSLTQTPTPSAIPNESSSSTPSSSTTPTPTPILISTPSPSATATPVPAESQTPTPSALITLSPSPSSTPLPSPTQSPTPSVITTPSVQGPPLPTSTSTPTATPILSNLQPPVSLIVSPTIQSTNMITATPNLLLAVIVSQKKSHQTDSLISTSSPKILPTQPRVSIISRILFSLADIWHLLTQQLVFSHFSDILTK